MQTVRPFSLKQRVVLLPWTRDPEFGRKIVRSLVVDFEVEEACKREDGCESVSRADRQVPAATRSAYLQRLLPDKRESSHDVSKLREEEGGKRRTALTARGSALTKENQARGQGEYFQSCS